MSAKQTYRVAVLPGDGIGPEITDATLTVLDAALGSLAGGVIELVRLPIGPDAIEALGSPLPEQVVQELTQCDAWILGPHDSVSYPPPHNAALNLSGAIRKRFDLYANIRPARTFGKSSRYTDAADLVVVWENTEGFYADRNTFAGTGEWMPAPDVAVAQGVFTRRAIERVARSAAAIASTRTQHITIVHKANVLRLTSGLFRDACLEVIADYPEWQLTIFILTR